MAQTEYPFSFVVMFDQDGAIRGVNVTCDTCGEIGYKDPTTALIEHARTHREGVRAELLEDSGGAS